MKTAFLITFKLHLFTAILAGSLIGLTGCDNTVEGVKEDTTEAVEETKEVAEEVKEATKKGVNKAAEKTKVLAKEVEAATDTKPKNN